jgi:hypothetical protein
LIFFTKLALGCIQVHLTCAALLLLLLLLLKACLVKEAYAAHLVDILCLACLIADGTVACVGGTIM